MPDSHFFDNKGPFSLQDCANFAQGELYPKSAGQLMMDDIAGLGEADEKKVSFLANEKYKNAFINTKAGAVIIPPQAKEIAPKNLPLIITGKPYEGYARLASAFYPKPKYKAGIDETAKIHATAKIGNHVHIGAYVVIDEGAVIGDEAVIMSHCHIAKGVSIGHHSFLGPSVHIAYSHIGAHCEIQNGCVIGATGFGFAQNETGHIEVPQLGRVMIGDSVAMGANCTIDRGMGPDTIIGDGTRMDNLVHIAHNVVLGKHCVLAGQVGIAGSTKIGDFVQMGGQAGIAGHLQIGSYVMIAAKSGVTKNISDRQVVAGFPAQPITQWRRMQAMLKRLTKK